MHSLYQMTCLEMSRVNGGSTVLWNRVGAGGLLNQATNPILPLAKHNKNRNRTTGSPLDFARFGEFIFDGFEPRTGLEVALLANRESPKFRGYVINMKQWK